MRIDAIQTPIFEAEQELASFVYQHCQDFLKPGSVVVVTSKIVSLAEGQVSVNADKQTLLQSEADYDLGQMGYGCRLTIKHGLMIPTAGIDSSNSQTGEWIMLPKDPFSSAQRLTRELRRRAGFEEIGVILSDSRTLPLRHGVLGVALSHWGFSGCHDLVGEKDLFGRELQMTRVNVADALASAAVLLMGEGAESRPLAVIQQAPVSFHSKPTQNDLTMNIADDMYFPLYQTRIQRSQSESSEE